MIFLLFGEKMDSDKLLNYLIEISADMAKTAKLTRERWHRSLSGKELERKIDEASAKVIKKYIMKKNLKFKVISEEGFEKHVGKGEYLIIDPVDGTSNLCRGLPFSSISLAIAKNEDMSSVYIGVVRDIFRGNVYYAIKGEGAYKDGRKIYVGHKKHVYESSISISITRAKCKSSKILSLLPYVPYPRYLGSAALETCYVAEGILDAYVDIRGLLRVFDIAAGQLIVKEAGGKVLILQNGGKNINLLKVRGISIIAAASIHLLEEITDITKLIV